MSPPIKIGRLTASDRASQGVYQDLSGPAIEEALRELFPDAVFVPRLLPDERGKLSAVLVELCDNEHCHLVITTGGTGPSPRDVTPEATRAVLDRELPGFGEIMRMKSFAIAPTAILTRATAGTRGRSLIVNLPGSPKAVRECLGFLAPALGECLKHLAE